MQTKHNLYYLLLFFQPYFGQNPRSTVETTVRAGVALKFGQKNIQEATDIKSRQTSFVFCRFSSNVPGDSKLTEIFPLRNVYFNNGSSQIPNRYVLLNKDQVKDFKEDQLEVFAPKIYQIVQKTNDCLL
jgi:hypothetical protein